MAAQTGSTYFSETMIDSVEILTAILGFQPRRVQKSAPK